MPAIVLLAGLLSYAFVLFLPSDNLFLDPDTLMHIAAGNWILQHQMVPQIDPFSFNTAGKAWIDHEWLAQCLMALTDQWGGLFGLRVLMAGLFGLTIALEAKFLIQRTPPIYTILLLVFCVFSLASHLLVRPHLFTWPIIVFWFSVLFDVVEGRRQLPYWLALLMIPWANLHGSFILGLALTPFFFLQAYFQRPKEERSKTIRPWALFILLSGLFSLVTPYGISGLKFGTDLISSEYISWIVEWAPTSGAQMQPLLIWVLLILGLSLLGGLSIPVTRFILFAGLFYEATQHVRYVSIFGLLAPLMFASAIGAFYYRRHAPGNSASSLETSFEKLSKPMRWQSYFIGLALIVAVTRVADSSVVSMTPPVSAPIEALKAARSDGAQGRVLNFYNFGGFLISQGVPVFIDGRADLYGNKSVNDYFSLIYSSDPEHIRTGLAQNKITWTIFPPNQKIVLYLDSQPNWKRIYEDKVAVVHVKTE